MFAYAKMHHCFCYFYSSPTANTALGIFVNGIRLRRNIEDFEFMFVWLKNDGVIQVIYERAISAILSSRSVSLDGASASEVVIKKRRSFD